MLAGALVAWFLFGFLLGPEGWKLAGCFCASYIGGSVNFAAVAKSLDLSPSLIPAAMAADNLTMAACLGVLMLVGAQAQRKQQGTPTRESGGGPSGGASRDIEGIEGVLSMTPGLATATGESGDPGSGHRSHLVGVIRAPPVLQGP